MRGLIFLPILPLFLMGATASQNLNIAVTQPAQTGGACPMGTAYADGCFSLRSLYGRQATH